MALYIILTLIALSPLFYNHIIYPALLSPLSKIPTPRPLSAILGFWTSRTWISAKGGSSAQALLKAHQAHGPIIRIGPNAVHVASLEGLRVAFNSGKFDRSSWILQFLNYQGTPNLVTMLDSKAHSTRRRILSLIFSKSYIHSSVDFHRLTEIILFERLAPVFEDAVRTGEGVDVYEMGFAASTEFQSAYQVGTRNCLDLVRLGREEERRVYLENARRKILELEGSKEAIRYLEDQMMGIIKKTEADLLSKPTADLEAASEGINSNSTYPVVFAQLWKAIPVKEGVADLDKLRRLIGSELIDNLEAGRVGMGITITYALHELCLRPDVQTSLRQELLTLEEPLTYPRVHNRISTTMLRQFEDLALMDAILTETLRAHNPILIPFERVVPPGGTVINGYFIPAGTIVASSALPLHMNPGPYPNPETWNPQRWLNVKAKSGEKDDKGRSTDDPRRWYWAFGSGGRMCSGNNFAILVMKLIIAMIITNYEIHIIDDEGIEQQDHMIASPVAEKLVLGFKRIL